MKCYVYLLGFLTLFSANIYGQTPVPDSLLYQEWNEKELVHKSQPWTEGCDSIIHLSHPGITFYFNADTFYHLVATRNFNEIIEETRYFYFILDMLDKQEYGPLLRDKLLKANKQYNSKALERELDVLDTYCNFLPGDTPNRVSWDFFWGLIEKNDRKGYLQTKLRIMERILYGCSGFPTLLVSTQIEKDQIPVLRLINEILATLKRMNGEYYMMGPAHFYTHIGLIYFDFKYYNKAVPLLWKATRLSAAHFYDRSVMRARDYLGDYYSMIGDYDRSDSLYLSILKSPDKVLMRPVDNVIATGSLAANANFRGNKEEAIRLYSIALPRALQVKDSTLAGGYALHLGRLYMEKGEYEKTGEMIERARKYLLAGKLPMRNWERYYTLNCDYNLKIHRADLAAPYIDSISYIRKQEESIYNTRILAYAEQEAYEMENILKEEQLSKQRLWIYMGGIILGLTMLLMVILLFFNRKLQKKNHDLFLRIKANDFAAARHEQFLLGETTLSELDDLSDEANKRELFIRLREYLMTDKNFTKAEVDTNNLVNVLSTNRTYLYEVIKSFTGKTFQEYINYLRLEEAKHLLETTDEVVEQIAAICGYNSVRTFYRLFRVNYNISPTVYRRIARK